jgi:hypothetical protein
MCELAWVLDLGNGNYYSGSGFDNDNSPKCREVSLIKAELFLDGPNQSLLNWAIKYYPYSRFVKIKMQVIPTEEIS